MQYTFSRASRLAAHLSLLLLIALGGCGRLTSIYRSDTIPPQKPHLVSIDAKQRTVLTAPVKDANGATAAIRFCAEAPPDVFTALAASVGAEASTGQGADPAVAAKLATSIAENAATVERSQTVNVLREVMYRSCERYLSGAYDAEEFIVQAARDQQLIVQVLAIEQITGAARAQATALTTVAKSAASGVTDTGIETLATAKKDFDAKLAASDKARADANTLAPAGDCPAKPYDASTPPPNTTAAQVTAKNDACAAAKTAETRAGESKAYLATVQEAVARQSEVSSQAQGAISSATLQAAAMSEAVARQVVDIVKQNSAFDEIGMTCVVKLRQLERGEDLPAYCINILDRLLQTRQAQLLLSEGLDPDRIQAFSLGFVETAKTNAEVVWRHLDTRGGISRASLAALEKSAGVEIPAATMPALLAAKAYDAFTRAFQRLSKPTQTALRGAAERANAEVPP